MAWPKVVPILDRREFCQESYTDGDKCCLVGHAIKVFGGKLPEHSGESIYPSTQAKKVIRTIKAGILRRGWWREMWRFNDEQESLQVLADVWNEAMSDLGYTEPCDR